MEEKIILVETHNKCLEKRHIKSLQGMKNKAERAANTYVALAGQEYN